MTDIVKKKPNRSSQNSDTARNLNPEAGVYQWYVDEDQEDRKSLRTSMAVALIVHIAFLFATIPTMASKEVEAPEKKYVRLTPTPKFKKTPPLTPEKREPKPFKIPIPDPDPDEPEIFVTDDIPMIETEVDIEITWDSFPPAPPVPEPTDPIRVGGEVSPPERTHYVKPRYTEIARKARIQGIVVMEAVIDKKGRVSETKVLRDLPFGLSDEAVKAVNQWTFKPSTLNGKPVDVIYVLTVRYTLN